VKVKERGAGGDGEEESVEGEKNYIERYGRGARCVVGLG